MLRLYIKDINDDNKPVELFKLHLSNLPDHKKPILPVGLDYKTAISDYLREIGKVRIKNYSIQMLLVFE